MRFRKVGAEVMDGPGGGLSGSMDGERRPDGAHVRNRETMVAFVTAWMRRDQERLLALSTGDLECRWIGFGGSPVTARGLDEVLHHGADFERRYGVAEHYNVVEAMGGEQHAAFLFEPADMGQDRTRVARVAVYRITDDRVSAIAVYADLPD